jgi:hypothetical protein
MVYLKSDEEVHRKFEEDNALLQMQSKGQEALIDNFQCYKTGYNKGKAEVRSDTAKQIFAELDKQDTGYGDIVLSKEELQELKKKNGVD